MGHWKLLLFSLLLLAALQSQPADARRFRRLLRYLSAQYSPVMYEPPSPYKCDNGGYRYRDRCFKIITRKMSYYNAMQSLKGERAHIVDNLSSGMASAILRIAKKYNVKKFYIGLKFTSYKKKSWYQRVFKVRFKKNKCLAIKLRRHYFRFYLKNCEDRLPFLVEYKACKSGQFRCFDGKRCIEPSLKCNGLKECNDGSDEDLPECKSCGGKLTAASGKITSPNYPGNYKPDSMCKWEIKLVDADFIKITFNSFHTESEYDVLYIYYGNWRRTIWGNHYTPPRETIYYNDLLIIVFKSDYSRQFKGFSLKYEKGSYNTPQQLSTFYESSFTSEVFKENYSKYWVYQSTQSVVGMSLALREFLFDPACKIDFYSDTNRNNLIVSYAGTGSSLSYSVFSETKFLVVSLTCGSGFTVKPSKFRLSYQVETSFKVTLTSSLFGTLTSPPRYQKLNVPYSLGGLSSDIRFVATQFELLEGIEYIIFRTARYHLRTEFEKAVNDYLKTTTGTVTITFSFVRTTSRFSGSGFKISFAKNCRTPEVVEFNGRAQTLHAPNGYVFDNPELEVTSKKFTCTVGGFLSPSYVIKKKRCNILFQTGYQFDYFEVLALKLAVSNQFDDVVAISCPFGYKTGRVKIKCTMQGWARTTTACVRSVCTQGNVGSHLKMRSLSGSSILPNKQFPYNTYVKFSCDKGYELVGSWYKICFVSGSWSHSDPSCKEIKCKAPSRYKNLFVEPDKEFTMNKPAVLKCPIGKRQKVSDVVHVAKCVGSNNEWDTNFFFFVLSSCVYNGCYGNPCGKHTCKETRYGYRCICKDGYALSWNGMCRDINECNDPWRRSIGCHTCHNTEGSYYCTCRSGYVLFDGTVPSGHERNIPQSWIRKTCLALPCPAVTLRNSHRTSLSAADRLFGHSNRIYCKSGHQADDWSYYELRCAWKDGMLQWNTEKRCKIGQCSKRFTTKKGALEIFNSTYGSSAKLICDEGYTLKDAAEDKYYCQQWTYVSGYRRFYWSGRARCVRKPNSKSCPDLEAPFNGKVLAMTDVGGIAVYSCDFGFALTSSPYRFCKTDGSWSGAAPSCELMICPQIVITGREVTVTQSNGRLKFQCLKSGYMMVGDQEIYCAKTDAWVNKTSLMTKTAYFCDSSFNFIGCPNGRVIYPVYALYGYEFRTPSGCGSNASSYPTKACGDPHVSLRYINTECKGKRTCWVPAFAQKFNTTKSTVCKGKTPMMEVTYLCRRRGMKPSSVFALLACEGYAHDLLNSFLQPNSSAESAVAAYNSTSNFCRTSMNKKFLGCLYMKARVIDNSVDMLKYIAIKHIVQDGCASRVNATACARCVDMQKRPLATPGMPDDFCAPPVKACFKACWKNNSALLSMFDTFTSYFCPTNQFISTSAMTNLLLNEYFAPLTLGRAMRSYRVQKFDGTWQTVTSTVNLASEKLEFSGKAYSVQVWLTTYVRVKAFYVMLDGETTFGDKVELFTMTGSTATLSKVGATVTYVRGDVIKIAPKAGHDRMMAFRIVGELKTISNNEKSSIRMSVSYYELPTPKMIKCYECLDEASSDNCQKIETCSMGDNYCYSEWSRKSGEAKVTKGCKPKTTVRQLMAGSYCGLGGITCSSYCDKDLCNGYGRCPPWAPQCVPGLNSDTYNLTMATMTNDPNKLRTCLPDITNFLWKESQKLFEAFKTDSCKFVHLSYEQHIHSTSTSVYMVTAIKRKYMSHEGAACLYSGEKRKHAPFKLVMEKWQGVKTTTVCFGAVGFTLKSRIYHRCAQGMRFNSDDGWCIPKEMIMPANNVLMKKDAFESLVIKSDGVEYKLDTFSRFRVTSSGYFVFTINFKHKMVVDRVILSIVGAGFSISSNEYAEKKMMMDLKYSVLTETFSLEFYVHNGARRILRAAREAFVFVTMRVTNSSLYPIGKCYSCKNAMSEYQCLNETVECALGYQACFTDWHKVNNLTLVSKGCRTIQGLSKVAMMNKSSCYNESVRNATNSTLPCTSYSLVPKTHGLCPVWESSCKPGLNSVYYSFTVLNRMNVNETSDCVNKTMESVKKWIVSQIEKGARSIFGNHSFYIAKQINMTTYKIDPKWTLNGTVFHVTLTSTYFSYKLARLRMPITVGNATDAPLQNVTGCPNHNVTVVNKTVTVLCAFNKTYDSKTELCHSEQDLHVDKNLALNDSFKLEVRNSSGILLHNVTADHFEVSPGKTYSVKAKFGSRRSVKSIVVHYYGLCDFLSRSAANISAECSRNNTKNAAIDCVMKKVMKKLTYEVDNTVSEYSFNFTLQQMLMKCRDPNPTFVAIRVYYEKVTPPPSTRLTCASCKKDDCKSEVCKSDEICYAHVKKDKKNSGVWEMQKAECKKQKSCKDAHKCNKDNTNCHVCCSLSSCNTLANASRVIDELSKRRRRRRRSVNISPLKLNRAGAFVSTKEMETQVTEYPKSNVTGFVNLNSTANNFIWIGSGVPRCKDTTPPYPVDPTVCKSPTFFDEYPTKPTRRIISILEVLPLFRDNSLQTPSVKILNSDITLDSTLNLTDWKPFILMLNVTDPANNTLQCNVTVQWRDVTPPNVTCPKPDYVQKEALSSINGSLSLPTINASDVNNVSVVHYSRKNGTLLAQGIGHEVNVKINDTRGNVAWCNYTHTILSTKCSLHSIRFTSRSNLTVRIVDGITTTVRFQCEPGYSFGSLFSAQKNGVMCINGVLDIASVFTGTHVVPPCLYMSGIHTLTYEVKLSDECCPSQLKRSALKDILLTKAICLKKFASSVSLTSQNKRTSATECTSVITISYHYDNSYDVVAKLKTCGDEVDTVIATNLNEDIYAGNRCRPKRAATLGSYKSGMSCPTGHVSNKLSSDKVKLCVPCYKGTYFKKSTDECVACDYKTYQDENAQTKCKKCPKDHGTLFTGSIARKYCLKRCAAGTYKEVRPYGQCTPCAKGSWAKAGSTKCTTCPTKKSTAKIGAKSSKDCKDECPKGQYSSYGVKPCKKCPRDSYQDEIGQVSCKNCPANKVTRNKGSTSSSDCLATNTVDVCSPNPCKNGASCKKHSTSFECTCKEGFWGSECQNATDPCSIRNPCVNGRCSNDGTSYKCTCDTGWNGTHCDTRDYCSTRPCKHGSTCKVTGNDFQCENCPAKYTGKRCNKEKDPCADKPCKNEGTCKKDGGTFTCSCASGFTGSKCQNKTAPCDSNPCAHSTCKNVNSTTYKCECEKGWTGTQCDTDINECSPTNPCMHGGTCNNTFGSYNCDCKDGYAGENCSVNINECASNPCKHGTCEDGVNSYTCDCSPGYNGTNCDQIIDHCATNNCDKAGGVCKSEKTGFKCECRPNYAGKLCDQFVDYCVPNPCHNNVRCVQGGDLAALGGTNVTDFMCECPNYRSGKRCEIQLDTCLNNTCRNEASCIRGTTNYTCSCPEGYEGTFCEDAIDLCIKRTPCKNGATCNSSRGGYNCTCTDGWTGTNCDEDFNECSDRDRCKNGGNCTNLPNGNGFSCACPDGYDGNDCSEVLPVCNRKPCKNGGSCFPVEESATNFSCICPTGFEGDTCEINIDDCSGNDTCKNNASCVDGINSFSCSCSKIHFGNLCDKVRSENVDMLFGGAAVGGSREAEFEFSFDESSTAFSVDYWFRSTSSNLNPTHFKLIEVVPGGTNKTVLSVTGKAITTEIGIKKNIASVTTSATKWSYIAVTCDSARVKYYVDGELVFSGAITGLIVAGREFKVVLGSQTFRGLISRVFIRNKVLTSTKITDNGKKCKLDPETQYNSDIQLDWRVMSFGHPRASASVCGESTCPAGKTGPSCDQTIDTEKPTVVYCPTGVTIVNTSLTPIRITFKVPEFKDNVGVKNIVKSHKPGDLLSRGVYTVTYTAYDAANNSEDCTFELSIVPHKCEAPEAPNNHTIVVCAPGDEMLCQVECKDPSRLVIPDDGFSFYSCSGKGWTPLVNGRFEIVGCVQNTPVKSGATGNYQVTLQSGKSCAEQEKTIKENFMKKMSALKRSNAARFGSLCVKDDCSDLKGKLKLNCGGTRRRRRRNTASLSYNLPGGTASTSALCSNIRTDTGSDGFKASSCPTTQPTCDQGYVLNDARTSCIACNAGYSHINAYDTTCTPCAKGTYTAVQATSGNCTDCPNNQTTPGVGAAASDLCYTVCPAGQYMDTTSGGCKACPVGSRNPSAGQAQCIACPPGETAVSGSTTCKKCAAGQQVAVNGMCVPCAKGQYRPNDNTQPTCVDCPASFTTASIGATAASQCDIPICNAGHYLSSKVCKPCHQGTYQALRGQISCLRCPRGHTTSKPAATNSSDCIPGNVNECAVGSATCHKYATCTDTSTFFNCTCNAPNWTGDGFNCRCAPSYSGDACQVLQKPPLSDAQIIGIAVGCTLAVIVIVAVLITIYLKKTIAARHHKGGQYDISNPYDYNGASNENKAYELEMK